VVLLDFVPFYFNFFIIYLTASLIVLNERFLVSRSILACGDFRRKDSTGVDLGSWI
jgi:hypothetical protein